MPGGGLHSPQFQMDSLIALALYSFMNVRLPNYFGLEKRAYRLHFALAAMLLVQPAHSGFGQSTDSGDALLWRDARELTIEGKGWMDTQSFYDRLPARAESIVRRGVWGLSHNSAGLRVRFVSDATRIAARWSLRGKSLEMAHMPASGVSGLDLYVKRGRNWFWLGAGRPSNWPTNEAVLVSGLKPIKREYALYLPLYNGVHEVKVGFSGGNVLEPPGLTPAIVKPILFYGTSIVQGGCAARPGMAYPAILGRRLDWPTINLGFSGNAFGEPEMADLLAELDPAIFVLDPLPNMTDEMVASRMESFITSLRRAHPRTPIVLVESIDFPAGEFVVQTRDRVAGKNAKLKEIYQRLTKSGQKRIIYVSTEKLIGHDGEATVDGVHPTDLGFVRMADALEPVLRRALKAGR
jgi:lysophospholipase L1-like esterase